jgi:hypothetical protein
MVWPSCSLSSSQSTMGEDSLQTHERVPIDALRRRGPHSLNYPPS